MCEVFVSELLLAVIECSVVMLNVSMHIENNTGLRLVSSDKPSLLICCHFKHVIKSW